MAHNDVPDGQPLERYRAFLRFLARLHLPPELWSKLDASDVVQETFLKAFAALKQGAFEPRSEAETAGYLRTILENTLRDLQDFFGAEKRKAARERSLQADFEASSARLAAWLAADQSTPSQQVMHHERLLRLADALAQLPEDQRTAVELKHVKGMSVSDIARHLHKTNASVAGLLRRGLERLRELLGEV